jgi:hypothetical protein
MFAALVEMSEEIHLLGEHGTVCLLIDPPPRIFQISFHLYRSLSRSWRLLPNCNSSITNTSSLISIVATHETFYRFILHWRATSMYGIVRWL